MTYQPYQPPDVNLELQKNNINKYILILSLLTISLLTIWSALIQIPICAHLFVDAPNLQEHLDKFLLTVFPPELIRYEEQITLVLILCYSLSVIGIARNMPSRSIINRLSTVVMLIGVFWVVFILYTKVFGHPCLSFYKEG